MSSNHVSRSVYQKVVEQNKRLLKDLKIICYFKNEVELMYANQIMDKWHDYFHEREKKEQFLRDVAMEYLRNHPELDIMNWKK